MRPRDQGRLFRPFSLLFCLSPEHRRRLRTLLLLLRQALLAAAGAPASSQPKYQIDDIISLRVPLTRNKLIKFTQRAIICDVTENWTAVFGTHLLLLVRSGGSSSSGGGDGVAQPEGLKLVVFVQANPYRCYEES